jgi:hypothetical protein
MPVSATDLVPYASANHPWDDTSTAGGAIDTNYRVIFDDLPTADDLEVVSSDNGDDSQEVTVWARKANGQIVSETVTLDGTTPVAFGDLGVVERILRVSLDATATGDVTVRRSGDAGDVAVIPAGELGVKRLFTGAYSDPDSGKVYYEKFFWKNNHATLAALEAVISELSGGVAGQVDFALEAVQDGTQSIANRLTEPSGGLTFNSSAKAVVGTGDLPEDSAQGVWVRLTLSAGNLPVKDVWNTQISFQSV